MNDADLVPGSRARLDRHFGDYILGRQLGSGGMGIVYEARQVSLNRTVALKFIRDSQVASPVTLRRFTIEAEATARLHHPNIVGIHEIGEFDGQPYFSMDLVEGDSLRVLLGRGEFTIKADDGSKSNGRSRQVTIARLMAKTARALHHAHQRGVLHRDLKPANILVDAAGEPHVSDFGLAKILRDTTETDTRQSLTGSGDIAGTPSYMSPEQAASAETTGASDVYGLGAVLYEMLTGKPPFRGHTAFETLQQVRESPPKPPRSINRLIERDLETICLKCLEKDPLRRFASPEALAEDLENWIEHKPIRARPVGTAVRAGQWMQRNRAGTALIAALLVGLSAAIVLLAIVNHQSRKRSELTARMFDGKVRALTERWHDPNTTNLTITPEDLAILANRDPSDAADAQPILIGAVIRGDAINFAQRHATVLGDLETILGEDLGQPIQIGLILSKAYSTEAELLTHAQVDFAILNATSFVEAQRDNTGLTALARIRGSLTGALVANAKITNFISLRGKSVFFTSPKAPLTMVAKARLAEEGLHKDDVQARYLDEDFASRRISREILSSVILGRADAGVTTLRRFQLDRHRGLSLLAPFSITQRLIAARSGLSPKLITAFQKALLRLPELRQPDRHGSDATWEEETVLNSVPIEPSDLETVKQVLRGVARFDQEPDPFPPGSR